MRTVACLLAMILSPLLAAESAAQNVLDEARRHYEAAAYEEALSVLARADRSSGSQTVQVEQYRAFCFIALGRAADAESAVTALVEADPLYLPTASPRIMSVVSEIRRNVLPAVARRLLDDGRAAFTEKNFDKARESFQLLLRVLADPAMQGRSETADLRVLAEGFATLAAASPPPAAPPAADAPAPEAAEPRPSAPVVVPAVPVSEVLPPWAPDLVTSRFEYSGMMRITIGVDGRVKSARIEDPSHASYDLRLLQSARSWVYKPATRNGEPVEFDRLLEIRLLPPASRQRP